MRQVEQFSLEAIAVLPGRRKIDPSTVDRLAESIKSIGLRTPITVRLVDGFVDNDGVVVDGQPVLVTGAHRLAAIKKLRWDKIECFLFDGDDEVDAQLWEIAENLHRADLSALERSEQVAEWVKLTEERLPTQVVSAALPDGRKAGPQHQSSGIRAASRELGIDREKARRSVKIASISDEAKAAAKEAGLENNQSALERIAKSQDQVGEVQQIKKERSAPKPPPEDFHFERLKSAWNAAPEGSQKKFLKWVNA